MLNSSQYEKICACARVFGERQKSSARNHAGNAEIVYHADQNSFDAA